MGWGHMRFQGSQDLPSGIPQGRESSDTQGTPTSRSSSHNCTTCACLGLLPAPASQALPHSHTLCLPTLQMPPSPIPPLVPASCRSKAAMALCSLVWAYRVFPAGSMDPLKPVPRQGHSDLLHGRKGASLGGSWRLYGARMTAKGPWVCWRNSKPFGFHGTKTTHMSNEESSR